MKLFRTVIAVISLLFSATSIAECLIEGQELSFTGRISQEIFPGPPNYESIENGDSLETYWIFTISTPQCIKAESDIEGELYKAITRFQLAFKDNEIYTSQKSLVGNTVSVKGELFLAVSGHHHTEALILVKDLMLVIH